MYVYKTLRELRKNSGPSRKGSTESYGDVKLEENDLEDYREVSQVLTDDACSEYTSMEDIETEASPIHSPYQPCYAERYQDLSPGPVGYDPRFAASEENGRLTLTPEPVYQPRLTRTVSVPLITLSPQVAQHQRWSNFQPPELATTLNGTEYVVSSAINDLGLDRRSGAELISQGLNALSLPESDQETCLWEGCGIMMNSLKELVAHIIKQHVQNDAWLDRNVFVCNWRDCTRQQKPFKAQYQLTTHIRSHTGEKPHTCPYDGCAKAYSRMENLKTHLRTHTGEKPYSCPECDKKFNNSSDRAKHRNRTHTRNKMYCCPHECLKQYTDPSSLRKHLMLFHKEGNKSRKKSKEEVSHRPVREPTSRRSGLGTIMHMKDFINQNQNDLNQFPGSPEGDHMSVYSPGATPQHMYSYPPQTPPYAAPYYTSNSSLNSDMSDNSCHSSTVSQVSNASSYNSLTAAYFQQLQVPQRHRNSQGGVTAPSRRYTEGSMPVCPKAEEPRRRITLDNTAQVQSNMGYAFDQGSVNSSHFGSANSIHSVQSHDGLVSNVWDSYPTTPRAAPINPTGHRGTLNQQLWMDSP